MKFFTINKKRWEEVEEVESQENEFEKTAEEFQKHIASLTEQVNDANREYWA